MTITEQAAADGIVVIGAGQAGGRAIEALRQNGFTGAITLIGDEIHLPYERPPLSKALLRDAGAQVAWVREAAWYDEAGITRHLGCRAVSIDRGNRAVELDDGTTIPYGILILATGARPRPLPIQGADHPACLFVRTLEDSARLLPVLKPGHHVVVIGAGFIGLEVAAAARDRGADVTVLEVGPLVMARGVTPEISAFYAALHHSQGVTLHVNSGATRISPGTTPNQAIVHTAHGDLSADAVVIGVGVIPNSELAEAAALAVENGIVVDDHGRTADPAIYAAGDVTRHPNPIFAQNIRLESWQNAQNQAIAVARNILGADKPYAEVPWFWSDQFGHNLQIAGLPGVDDQIIARGELGAGPALRFHLRHGRMVAALGIDAARDLRFAKEMIGLGAQVSAVALADPAQKLADLYKAAKAQRAAA